MINKAIRINCLKSHLLCPIQCCLNGKRISEIPKFLAKSPSVTTFITQLTDTFKASHLLIILLQLSSVTRYFLVYSLHRADYINDEIPKIHLTAEEPPWDPLMNEYSERET